VPRLRPLRPGFSSANSPRSPFLGTALRVSVRRTRPGTVEGCRSRRLYRSPIPTRDRVAEQLQRACGDGRLTLDEFSTRVAVVWAADTSDELARATSGLALEPAVGTTATVERVITIFSESKRRGRWRFPAGALRTFTLFGSCQLDLREAITGADVIEITGTCVFGEVVLIVPDGVEVDLAGTAVFGSRDLHLAPVPRVPGTPTIRVSITNVFASVEIRSATGRS
jgi:hypothetical protein